MDINEIDDHKHLATRERVVDLCQAIGDLDEERLGEFLKETDAYEEALDEPGFQETRKKLGEQRSLVKILLEVQGKLDRTGIFL